jgi:hypothetical protein
MHFNGNIILYTRYFNHKECYRQIKCNTKWFYRTLLFTYLYIDCILVDFKVSSDRNMLLKNTAVWLSIFINVHLLVFM